METAIATLVDHVEKILRGRDDVSSALETLRDALSHPHSVDADAMRSLVSRLLTTLQRDGGPSPDSVLLVAGIALLSRSDPTVHTAAIEAGALSLVVNLRGPSTAPCSDPVERVALAATVLLVHGHALAQAGAARAEMGVVASLVRALSSTTSSVATLALLGLQELVLVSPTAQLTALHASAVTPLCRQLRTGFPPDRARAAIVLRTMLHNRDVATALTQPDVVALSHVVEMLQSPLEQDHESLATLATAVLTRAAAPAPTNNHDHRVRALLRELRSVGGDDGPYEQLLVLEDLSVLMWSSDAPTAQAAVEDGLVPICLTHVASRADHARRSVAAFALMGLLVHHQQLHGAVRDAIGMDTLVEQIMTGNTAAVYVLGPLVDSSCDARAEAAAAGAVAALVGVLRDGLDQEAFVAARALSWLVRVDDTTREEALHVGTMEQVLRFLAATTGYGTIHALTTIECLARTSSGTASAARDAFLCADGARTLVASLHNSEGMERFATGDVILTLITDHTVMQAAFVDACVVEPLTQCLLEDEAGSLTSIAVQVLGILAERNTSVKTALTTTGTVIPRVVQLVATGADDQKRYAVGALGRIAAGDAAVQTAVAEAGGVDVLIQFALSAAETDEASTIAAPVALGEVVYNHADNQARAIRGHALLPLVVLLRRGGPSEGSARRALAYLLGRTEPLEATTEDVQTAVLRLLVGALQHPSPSSVPLAPILAAHTLEQLVVGNAANQSIALEAGVLDGLVAMLTSARRDDEELAVEMAKTASAARAFACVVYKHREAKMRALERHDAVEILVDVLRREPQSGPHRAALWLALLCLVQHFPDAHGRFLGMNALGDLAQDLADPDIETVAEAVAMIFTLVEDRDQYTIDAMWDAQLMAPLLATLPRLANEKPLGQVLLTVVAASTNAARRRFLADLFPLEAVMERVVTGSDSLLLAALTAICTLVDDDAALRRRAIDGGALTVAVAMVREPRELGALPPCLCLATLVADDAHAEQLAVEQLGAIELLAGLLPTLPMDDRWVMAVALASIRTAQREALASGVVAPLLAELQPSAAQTDDIISSIVRAVAIFVDRNATNQIACADAGALPLVLELVQRDVTAMADSVTRRRYAARALFRMVDGNPSVQRRAVEAGALVVLHDTLNTIAVEMDDDETRRSVEAALALLTGAEMARSGVEAPDSASWSALQTKREDVASEDALTAEARRGVGA